MNILVTGNLTHITKQFVRQLVENGHNVHYQATEGAPQPAPVAYDWLIQGLLATPQQQSGAQTGLRTGFKQLQADST